ncbi:hypothetical protein [Chryseobacterium sp.]|jgi:hypothetical protein|uniref:hypothetical protein n=1 Tax=Chryseobacterium sp. TaxID=1871047 RepID=UPI002842A718|nr:hypothetical protein [Chryseobacterium sp.]MDR3023940.1 hypothetical protein [Chryseobacterium sp.]
MEENNLTTRDQLKNYFETGKYPTESQFADLIDSLRLREDVFTKKELAKFANSLTTLDNLFVNYLANGVGSLKFSIVISTNDEPDQVISSSDFKSLFDKQYVIGSAPYTIKIKEIFEGDLGETEYYILAYQLNQTYIINRLFGNNLKAVSAGFDFGEVESIGLPIQITKGAYGQKINVLNTSVKFINKTEVPILYRIEAVGWSNRYRDEDTVTDHYDLGDYLTFFYKADLTNINQHIKCDVYNADNNTLLTTGYLSAGQNQNSVNGGRINEVRNVRIECSYYENVK